MFGVVTCEREGRVSRGGGSRPRTVLSLAAWSQRLPNFCGFLHARTRYEQEAQLMLTTGSTRL